MGSIGRLSNEGVGIREASRPDLQALTRIYNHYIETSHTTFLTQPQTPADREPWLDSYLGDNPYCLLVAEQSGVVVGFAGAGAYRTDPGFQHTVETSLYLEPSSTGRGIGSLLYRSLLRRIGEENFHVALAGIALPNDASVALHRKFGFDEIGVFSEYAVKWDQFISSVWMQKQL